MYIKSIKNISELLQHAKFWSCTNYLNLYQNVWKSKLYCHTCTTKMAVLASIWMLLCLLFSFSELGLAQVDPCNNTYTEISISSNGSSNTPSTCTNNNGSKCASVQYALSTLSLKNCTRLSLYKNQTINSIITIKSVNGLILQGLGASTTITCINQGSGLAFINCSNVQSNVIEWINCNLNSTSLTLCPMSGYGIVSQLFSRQVEESSLALCPSSIVSNYTNEVMLGEAIATNFSFQEDPRVYAKLACSLNGADCNDTYKLHDYRHSFVLSGTFNKNVLPVLMWYNATDIDGPPIHCMNISVTDCHLGFVYDTQNNVCACYNSSGDNEIVCNISNGTACVKTGYWYGQIDNNDNCNVSNATCTAAFPCPFGYCNYTVSSMCPTQSCPDHKFYCLLNKSSDDLCLYNRGGTLCSICKEGYRLSFDGIRCFREEKCHSGSVLLYILIFILFWALLTIIIVIVTKLNLRIGSGQLYCLVFFFSVLQYFVRGTFPSTLLYVVELIFTGFMQLDPKMLGLFEVCLKYSNINNLHYTALCCINPLYLMLAIGLLICISSKCPKYAYFNHNNGAVNMICIVIYLVFISLTQTSLSLLAPVRYPSHHDKVYVALEPNVTYFDPKTHLSYAVFAILIQLFLVVPFLSLLLFAPWLIKIKILNLTRIKPILDEYQACYKEQYRSFAGFYLSSRQLIFLISLFPISMTTYIYILQILSILLLSIHCLVQPYTSLWLNVLDGFLILDLVLLSILHGSTANVVFASAAWLKTTLVYLLVLLPVVYFIGMCLIQFARSTLFKRVQVDCGFMNKRKKKRVRDKTNSPIADGRAEGDDDPKVMEREPLLFHTNLSYDSLVINSKEGEGGGGGTASKNNVTVVEVTH